MTEIVQVLIVDDIPSKLYETVKLVRSAIGNNDSIDAVVSISGALERLNEKPYDLIILGYISSKNGIGSFELSQIIKGTYANTRSSGKMAQLQASNDLNKGGYIVGNSPIWCENRSSSEMDSFYEGMIDCAINPELRDNLEERFNEVISQAISSKNDRRINN